MHGVAASSPEAKLGVRQLRALTFFFFYGLPDECGPQRQLGRDRLSRARSSAPPSPEQAPKTIAIERIAGESATLEADVCVVGSGAGGA